MYSCVALLSLMIFLIINYDIILKKNADFEEIVPALKEYRRFLCSVLVFFSADVLWGFFEEAKFVPILYIVTMEFFLSMAFSVFLWTRYVIAYLIEKSTFALLLRYVGWFILAFECIVVTVNIFSPILFHFDQDGNYVTDSARHITMFIQLVLYFMTTVYLFAIAFKYKEKFRRRIAISAFGLVMSAFLVLQTFYPMLPMYSAGYIIGTCLLHTFVLEDYKRSQIRKLKELLENETRQRKELGEARRMAYYDALTSVRNKHAYVEAESDIDRRIAQKELKEFGIIVFDLNGLKYVNDHYGHETGDRYLKDACAMICDQFKHSAVFRIGGDEFVALLEGADFKNKNDLLEDFNKKIEENISKKSVIVSTGLGIYDPESDNSFNNIFIRADKKMYERKNKLKEMGSI